MTDDGAYVKPGLVLLALQGDRPELDDAGFKVLWFDAAARSEIAPSDLLGRPDGRCKWGAAGSAWVQNLLRLRAHCRFSQEEIGLRFLAAQGAYSEEDVSGEGVRKVRDRLISAGLVKVKNGCKKKESTKGVASLLNLTEAGHAALDKLLDTLAPSSANQGQSQPAEPGETVIVKDLSKGSSEVSPTRLAELRHEMEGLNEKLKAHEVKLLVAMPRRFKGNGEGKEEAGVYQSHFQATYLNTQLVTLAQADLHHRRIFNGSLETGGRLYASYQNFRRQPFSEEEQKWAKVPGVVGYFFNGEPACELDIRCLHPRLVYNLAGLVSPHDAYDPERNQAVNLSRETVKKAVNTILNASPSRGKAGRQVAIASLTDRRPAALRGATHTPLSRHEAEQLLDSILAVQPVLRPLAYSGAWRTLQYVDSCISVKVMYAMLDQGIPALCVHDSWLAPASKRSQLEKAIRKAYQEVVGFQLALGAFKVSETWAMAEFGPDVQTWLAETHGPKRRVRQGA